MPSDRHGSTLWTGMFSGTRASQGGSIASAVPIPTTAPSNLCTLRVDGLAREFDGGMRSPGGGSQHVAERERSYPHAGLTAVGARQTLRSSAWICASSRSRRSRNLRTSASPKVLSVAPRCTW